MYCPKCKCEYVEFIRHCKDCDEKLVNELPPEQRPEEKYANSFVAVKNYKDEVAAQMDQGILVNNDIPSLITGVTVGKGGGMGILSEPQPICLMIKPEDLDHARALLESPDGGTVTVDLDRELPDELKVTDDGVHDSVEENKWVAFLVKAFVYGAIIGVLGLFLSIFLKLM